MTNRQAICVYNTMGRYDGTHDPVPSSSELPFFEYRGPGSEDARKRCKNCRYYFSAHEPEVMERNKGLKCRNFEPIGPSEFDLYYCGCRGWD